ncbi:MBL fold metallo-hydrolase [uncultured Sphingomonas sp.]|uniref:MBL fold metallo-hydrolase n=1 Tax=uncultured Sphingomonas sp. TaxID=158754 RepID=UPI0025DF227A|nr:MBL fold metallo-hydrolase [uncultured Sphingomonas sp.]
MRRALRVAGTVLLWLAVVLLLLPALLPPFLDRIYYRGPVSDHYNGARFFNPDGEFGTGGSQKRRPIGWMMRFMSGGGRTPWPKHVAVPPGYPAAAGTACPVTPNRARENWGRCVDHVDPTRMFATWVGHSTVLVQAGGINILTDPVWSERVGPFGVTGPKRVRNPGIRFDDLPKIDLILISHDHYDHMDLATLKRLWARDRPLIVTSLGNDTILRGVGVPAVAKDWGETVAVPRAKGAAGGPITVRIERVHHWGSRWMQDRNRALWSGFTVALPGGNLFYAGDTGFGDGSWPNDARKDGPFRLAIIPIGAFRPRNVMSGNHIGPEEAAEVFQRVGAAHALAVHWGTFQLSEEGIDQPPMVLRQALGRRGIAPGRFRAMEVGRNWEVPPLR